MVHGHIRSTNETLSELGLATSAAKLLPKRTVLVSIFATIGRTAVLDIEAATNQAIAGLTPKDCRTLYPSYLRYFLDYSVNVLAAEARGVAQVNINGTILKSLPVPVPPLAEQERIVNLLDEVDALRKLRAQADQRTAQLIPALFHDMFGDPATNPKGWPLLALDEVVDFASGATPPKQEPRYWSGCTPWVTPKDMKSKVIRDTHDHVTDTVFEDTNLRLVPSNTTLIVVRGMILAHTVPIRTTAVPVAINQDMKALLPKREMVPVFLRWFLQASHPTLLSKVSTAGHGTKKLDIEVLKTLSIPEVPLALQERFAEQVAEIGRLETGQAASRRHLDGLARSMLHRAFAGEL